jgi:hypothetical protein
VFVLGEVFGYAHPEIAALLGRRPAAIRQRPHRTLRMESPVPTARAPTGLIRSRPVLGGLHHCYGRAA